MTTNNWIRIDDLLNEWPVDHWTTEESNRRKTDSKAKRGCVLTIEFSWLRLIIDTEEPFTLFGYKTEKRQEQMKRDQRRESEMDRLTIHPDSEQSAVENKET